MLSGGSGSDGPCPKLWKIYPRAEELEPELPRQEPTNGNTMFAKLLQPENAEDPMLVTPSGIITLVSSLQPENAEDPMRLTPLPSVTFVMQLHPLNASRPMPVTLSGIVTLVSPLQPLNTAEAMPRAPAKTSEPEISPTTPITHPSTDLTFGIVVVSNSRRQPSNAEPSMLVTLLGIVTLVRLAQQ